MCEIEKWMDRNKKICVMTGVFGLLVAPFLWPFFLAIIFQSLSVALPLAAAWLFIKKIRKEKEETNETIRKDVQDGKNADAGKGCMDDAKTDDLSKDPEKTQQKTSVKTETQMPDEKSCLAIAWYQNEGRERILRIREKLDREGKKEFSISKDGICSARQEKGFQRIGVLRGYPGRALLSAEAELEKDGLSIKVVREFVWISWKRGNGCAL